MSGTHDTLADDECLMVFDTDCVLCSGAVGFILRHERDHVLRFVGAWSPQGLALAGRHGFSRADLDETFLLIRHGRVLTASEAVLRLSAHLKAPWRWLGVLRAIPRPLRDAAYAHVAWRRYRWFGRRTDCMLAPLGARHRFVGVSPQTPR